MFLGTRNPSASYAASFLLSSSLGTWPAARARPRLLHSAANATGI
ncbi:b46cb7d9-49be-44ac-b6e6-e1fca433f9d3 [Thermothielavioides terrestris]|uniref:B46cb7d9-49be-44ac-b6e6-e1fca433f9d3 n=1 Tax=Thermothielavioides terrestris TaxID=2587410 RepID=A0A3S5CXU0_9PEZI|nr:b46cb7d9-49be-44ac-b6e6-e1fca433f9d3 [Thermothielavioides terrestris]